MPLSLVGEYLYFLMVAALYGSPVVIGILWSYWRRDRVAAGFKLVAMLVPGAALAGMVLFRGGLVVGLLGYEGERAAINRYLVNPERTDAVRGAFVGPLRAHGVDYRRYQFPSLDGSTQHRLEVLLPSRRSGLLAEIRVTRDVEPEQAPARLLVWPASIGDNPALAPREFFADYFPGEALEAYGRHTLVLGLRPRQSTVVHPEEDPREAEWQWTNASLDL